MSKIALVTGASSGFGKDISKSLVEKGYFVIGTARRVERLKAIEEEVGSKHFFSLEMDISKPNLIDKALDHLPSQFKMIDVLVNNAGLALSLDRAYEADFSDWLTMINTNIIGLTYLTRKLLPNMVRENRGDIINIGSTAGHIPYPGANVYGATKAFVKQFSLNLKADLAGTRIRVTTIEPGLCEGTEFSNVRFKGDYERAQAFYEGANAIQSKDIANTVIWVLEQPAYLNVTSIELMPVSQSFGPQPVTRAKSDN